MSQQDALPICACGNIVAQDQADACIIEVGGRSAAPGTPICRPPVEEIDQRSAIDVAEAWFEFAGCNQAREPRSEEHTSELQSLMRISYAVFRLKKKKNKNHEHRKTTTE